MLKPLLPRLPGLSCAPDERLMRRRFSRSTTACAGNRTFMDALTAQERRLKAVQLIPVGHERVPMP